jgi:hypothetical protein
MEAGPLHSDFRRFSEWDACFGRGIGEPVAKSLQRPQVPRAKRLSGLTIDGLRSGLRRLLCGHRPIT